jgi:dTDP-4-amino-4,6-dideoxygalactose transaminase
MLFDLMSSEQPVLDVAAPIAVRGPIRARFLDLSVKDSEERAAILDAVTSLLDHGRLVMGPEVEEFERRVAHYCGRRHGIGVGTGTDALLLGVKSVGIGPGDEVITTPLSWLATGSSILLNGATAVFCDIDQTLNIDPGTIERHITARTKAILPVHFTGRLARMPEILEIAGRHNLRVIEDCAQAFGATFDDRPSGSFGDIACMSFNAMKILGGLGDGGIVLTDDDRVAARLRMLRHSGVPEREYCEELSHNCRLDTIQAAVLLRRLPRQPAIIARRRELARRYDRELAGTVQTPPSVRGYADVFYTYTIRTPRREELRLHLADCGIETRIQHPVLMNDQPAFQGKVRGYSPVAARLVSEILCIPCHEKLSDEAQSHVISTIRDFFGARP